jgi:DNA-binding CsgD family transcriptional regulator
MLDPMSIGMTQQECRLLQLVAQGLSYGEIAAVLRLSQTAAGGRVRRLCAKVGVQDRFQLVILGLQNYSRLQPATSEPRAESRGPARAGGRSASQSVVA